MEFTKQGDFLMATRDFFGKNLSEHGVIIFSKDSIVMPQEIKNYLKEKSDYLGRYETLWLRVYNKISNDYKFYFLVINGGKIEPCAFFDFIKQMCNRMSIDKPFYACDFESDKIWSIDICNSNEIGSLNVFNKLLGLDENNKVAFHFSKWSEPKGYKYFKNAYVFRNDADKDFHNHRNIVGYDDFDMFNSREEINCKLNAKTNTITLGKNTIIDFDIDNPNLSLTGGTIKARKLNIKDIECENLFCDSLKCRKATCTNIFTESVECENISASAVKTNYKYGVRLIE
jgi:hypothetical protein